MARGPREYDPSGALGRGLVVNIRAPKANRRAARDERGRFKANFAGEIQAQNYLLAAELQGLVYTKIQAAMLPSRRKASTNRLLRVTKDPSNIRANPERFGVGVTNFLNKSQAKYWRTQEEGSEAVWKTPFVGTQLTPFGKGSFRDVPFPVPHGATPRGIRAFTGKGPAMLGGAFVVKNEIRPMHAYRDAYREYKPGEKGNRALRQLALDGRTLRILAWDGDINMTR